MEWIMVLWEWLSNRLGVDLAALGMDLGSLVMNFHRQRIYLDDLDVDLVALRMNRPGGGFHRTGMDLGVLGKNLGALRVDPGALDELVLRSSDVKGPAKSAARSILKEELTKSGRGACG